MWWTITENAAPGPGTAADRDPSTNGPLGTGGQNEGWTEPDRKPEWVSETKAWERVRPPPSLLPPPWHLQAGPR